MRQVDTQRRYSDDVAMNGLNVCPNDRGFLLARGADPNVGTTSRIVAFNQVIAQLPLSLSHHLDTFHIAGTAIGKIDIDGNVASPAQGTTPTDDIRRMSYGSLPWHWIGVLEDLRQCNRLKAQQSAFNGRGDGARVSYIIANVCPRLMPESNSVGLGSSTSLLTPNKTASVGVPATAKWRSSNLR